MPPTNEGNSGVYIGATGHRPVPLATSIGVRPAHQPKPPRPTGLDWSKHSAPAPEQTASQQPVAISWPCRGCGQKSSELEKDLCPSCRDAVDAKFTVPTAVPDLPTEGNQGKPTTGSSAPGATSTSSTTGRAPVAGPSTHREKDPEPVQETRPATGSGPLDVVDHCAQLLRDTATSADPLVQMLRGSALSVLAALDHAHHPITTPETPVVASALDASSTRAPSLPVRGDGDATTGPEPIAATDPKHRRSHPLARRTRANTAEIKRRYLDEQQSIPEIARALDHSTSTVRRVLTDAGVLLRDDRARRSGGNNRVDAYPDELVTAIRTRYLDHQMTQAEVAADLDITVKVVQSVMAKHDIPARAAVPRQPRSVLTDPAQLDELCRRYEAGESGNALARAYGVSLPTILDRLRGRGITIRPRGSHVRTTTIPSGATA